MYGWNANTQYILHIAHPAMSSFCTLTCYVVFLLLLIAVAYSVNRVTKSKVRHRRLLLSANCSHAFRVSVWSSEIFMKCSLFI